MIRGQVEFMRGLLRQPVAVIVWVGWLVVVNGVGSLWFIGSIEAQVALVTFAAGGMLMGIIAGRTGFTRLLGLGHVFWVPLLIWLWPRLALYPAADPFVLWLRVLMVSNAVSLLVDIADVGRYIAGDREPQ